MKIYVLLINLIKISLINSFRIVGWFNGNYSEIENIPFDKYTHIVTGYPGLNNNFSTYCDKNDLITQKIVEKAHNKNIYVQWHGQYLNDSVKDNYLNTINKSMEDCNIDGIEIDYEWIDNKLGKYGIITPSMANKYTDYLELFKSKIGNKLLSIDMGIWGCCELTSSYPLEFIPWINVSRFNNGAFDFINVMSYEWNKNVNIKNMEFNNWLLKNLWKFNISKLNMAIAYFSVNSTKFKINSEPSWNTLSKYCPNINPDLNICNNIVFNGKNQNFFLGQYLKKNNFGGVFPWTLNYDSFEFNNTLINWLYNGIKSI